MALFDYLLVLITALGYVGLGRLLLPGRDLGRQFLAGLVPSGGVVAVLAAIAPVAIRPVLVGAIVAGVVVLLRDLTRILRAPKVWWDFVADWPLREVAAALGSLALFAILLGGLQYRLYDYSNPEEFPYMAPVVEMFLADYFGPLRIPTYYPAVMGAAHFVSFGVLAALCALLGSVTTPEIVEVRYLLAVALLARAFFLMWRHLGRSLWIFVPVAVGTLYLFQLEAIFYCIRSSTFLHFLVLTEICLIALIERRPAEPAGDCAAALFFAIALVMTKFVVVYLPAVLAAYYFVRFREHRFQPATMSILPIVAANAVATALLPKPFPDLNLSFSLVNPVTYIPTIDYYSKFADGFLTVFRDLGAFVGVPLTFAVAILKYHAVPLAAIDRFAAPPFHSETRRALSRGIEILLVAGLIGWIVVRNSQHGVTHQAWVLYILSGVAIPSIIAAATTETGWQWKGGLGAAVALFAALGVSPSARVPTLFGDYTGDPFMSYAHLRTLSSEEALVWRQGAEPPVYVGMRAVFFGVRLHANQVPVEYSGSLAAFIAAPRQ